MNSWNVLGMMRPVYLVALFLVAVFALVGDVAPEAWAQKTIAFGGAKLFIEYNSTDKDLGYHVSVDGKDWKEVKIVNPKGNTIFTVKGEAGGFGKYGITGLQFEGAEPPLAVVPLDQLLTLFPEGQYKFIGTTVDGTRLMSTATLTHAVPAAPSNVRAKVGPGHTVVISWDPVTGPPEGFPKKPIKIVGYRVVLDSFEVTVPGTSATVSPELIGSLGKGEHLFEVLALEAGGNQTIFRGSVTIP